MRVMTIPRAEREFILYCGKVLLIETNGAISRGLVCEAHGDEYLTLVTEVMALVSDERLADGPIAIKDELCLVLLEALETMLHYAQKTMNAGLINPDHVEEVLILVKSVGEIYESSEELPENLV